MAMIYDFHTHTSQSDGELSPVEIIRRAVVNGYTAIALTDHASPGEMKRIIKENAEVCALARAHWDIMAIPGIELTHVPADAIAESAKEAKRLGAWLVVVHGETIVEPVEKGTNLSALQSPDVDILAHPGLLTEEEARLATENGIYLEISARKGHSLTNGHVAMMAKKAGALLLLNSDSHGEGDLLRFDFAEAILRGCGLDGRALRRVMSDNAEALVKKVISRVKV